MSEARGSLDQRAESTLVSIAVLIVLQFLGHATSAPMHLPHRRRRRREVPRHIPRRDSQVHVRGGWSCGQRQISHDLLFQPEPFTNLKRDAEADLIDWRLDCCHRFNPSRKSSSTRLWKQRGRSRWILRKSPNSILACSRSISLLAKPSAKQARRINVIFRVGSTRVSRRTARSSRCRRSSPCYLGTRATLHVIEGADHSFHVLKEIQPDGFRRDTRVRRVTASWAELALHQK